MDGGADGIRRWAQEPLYLDVRDFGGCGGSTVAKGRGDGRGNSVLGVGLLVCRRRQNGLWWRSWNLGSASGHRVRHSTTGYVTSVNWIWRRVVARETASPSGRHA